MRASGNKVIIFCSIIFCISYMLEIFNFSKIIIASEIISLVIESDAIINVYLISTLQQIILDELEYQSGTSSLNNT